jgi:hypothetical protein
MPKCVYCDKDFSDTYELFEHMGSHNIQWKIRWMVEREERFMVVDTIPDLREERFTPKETPVKV